MTNLMPIDDIRESLQDRRLTVVAERCGLSSNRQSNRHRQRTNQSHNMEKALRVPE